jgi:pilus assembly protein TadC
MIMEKSKDKKEETPSMFSAFFSSLFSSIKDRIKQGADAVIDSLEERVLMLQKKMLRSLFIMLCIGVGIFALLLSLSFYLIDVLQWSRYNVLLVFGVALFIIASISAKLKD